MKRTVMFSLAALAVLTFANCSSESMDEMGGTSAQNNEIGFDGYLGRSAVGARLAQGTDNSIASVATDGFGVFACQSAGNYGSFVANLMNNVKVTGAGSGTYTWSYSDTKYWPKEQLVSFLAYAPYYDSNTINDTKVSYTASSQVDLIWSNVLNTKKPEDNSGKVKFTFKHALSRIGYKVYTDLKTAGISIEVKNVTLSGNNEGTAGVFYDKADLDLSKNAIDAEGLWTNESSTSAYTKTWGNALGTLTSSSTSIVSGNGSYLFIIPQDFSNQNNLYVTVEYVVKQGDATETIKVSKQITTNFKAGTAYTLNLKVGLDPIEFDADANITNWATGSIDDITLPANVK